MSGDLISRQAVLDAISSERLDYAGLYDLIKHLSPVNPQEPKTGHWVEHYDNIGNLHHLECSICHNWHRDHHQDNYCPNCGCKMVEPQESEG